jgi:hypothetical protein
MGKVLDARFPERAGVRSVIVVELSRVATSCGYAVPLMHSERDRDQLDRWAAKKGPEGLVEYRSKKNLRSIDGLPALAEEELG